MADTPLASAWPCGRWVEVIQSRAAEHVADPGRDRLLALVLVQRSRDLALEEEPVDALLEAANQEHRPVQPRDELRLGRLDEQIFSH